MVWAAFSGVLGRSELVIMERDPLSRRHGYSANSYLKVLDEQMPRVYNNHLKFMQDNGSIHSAKKVQDWLVEHGIIVLNWPPYSPDLNPIEHLWYHLKKAAYKIRPDIEYITGSEETIRSELAKVLPAAWELIRDDILPRLIESMDRRLLAFIKVKGWHTKY